jgi:hypothetical protein
LRTALRNGLPGQFGGSDADRKSLTGVVAEHPKFEVDDNLTMFGVDGFLRRARKRVIVSAGRPAISRLSRVIAHPQFTALYDVDGQKIPETSMYVMPHNTPAVVRERFAKKHQIFEPDTIDVSDLATCGKTIAFGGAPHAHFGHHLLDGMSRLWHQSEVPTLFLDGHLDFFGHSSFVSEFRALGRPRVRVDLGRPTLFTDVISPHASIQNQFRIFINADSEHLAIATAALRRARRPFAAKVYLSRQGLENRNCEGEEELESVLSQRGFQIVRPEQLPIIDQISLFNRANWIVGQMGSAFHNVLFAPRGARSRIVQFTWGKPNLRYPMIDRIKGHRAYYARTMEPEMINEKPVSMQLNVEQSLAVLQEIGALEPCPIFGYQPKRYWPHSGLLGVRDRIVFNFRSKPVRTAK